MQSFQKLCYPEEQEKIATLCIFVTLLFLAHSNFYWIKFEDIYEIICNKVPEVL